MKIRLLATSCVCMALAGCPSRQSPPVPVPGVPPPPPLQPTGGTLTFTVDDANDTLDGTTTLDLGDPETEPRCRPQLRAVPGREATDEELSFELSFDCYYEPGLRLILRVRGLPDARRWQRGELVVPLEGAELEVTHMYGGMGRGPGATCTSHGEGAELRVVVSDARGGPRPSPELADPDLLRVFTLELRVPSARGTPYGAARRPCPVVGVTLRAGYVLRGRALRSTGSRPHAGRRGGT